MLPGRDGGRVDFLSRLLFTRVILRSFAFGGRDLNVIVARFMLITASLPPYLHLCHSYTLYECYWLQLSLGWAFINQWEISANEWRTNGEQKLGSKMCRSFAIVSWLFCIVLIILYRLTRSIIYFRHLPLPKKIPADCVLTFEALSENLKVRDYWFFLAQTETHFVETQQRNRARVEISRFAFWSILERTNTKSRWKKKRKKESENPIFSSFLFSLNIG